MIGANHAKSGLAVGFALAAAVGCHSVLAALPTAITCAGYALAPDLDCDGSTDTRLLGPVTALLSWILEALSAVTYRLTATDHDARSRGTHRHLTHTVAFALVAGCVAHITSLMSTWAVVGWVAFGLLGAAAATSDWVLVAFAAAVLAPTVLGHASIGPEIAAMRDWVGLVVGVGCLVHCLGDAITVTGVPLLWPIPLGPRGRRQTWRPIHLLPHHLRLHTGLRMERRVVAPLLVAACVWACASLAPALPAAVRQLTGGVL